MINITDKTKCCGCASCANACPQKCIGMIADEEGFLYPEVNQNSCVNCGLCNKVCPIENTPVPYSEQAEGYVLRAKNQQVLMDSTSGGFFTPFAIWVLQQGGVVCAATYDDNFNVVHQLIENPIYDNELEKFRGSKYVQSQIGTCYTKIKQQLENERLVCFVGTTCQVAGLRAFLRKKYDNLFTVDLVCHGTPSPKLWRKYLDYQRKTYKSEITKISFRSKTYGYHSATMMIKFQNGKEYHGSPRIDYMLKCFFKEIASRPICYSCPFKGLERCSDLTVYDCWHISDVVSEVQDDDKGYTNVIIHSNKGRDVLNQLSEKFQFYKVDLEAAIEKDGIMLRNSASAHLRRAEFYKGLDENLLSEHIKKFLPISTKDISVEIIKKGLYHIGVLNYIKNIKNR